jgi:hypothetical protein
MRWKGNLKPDAAKMAQSNENLESMIGAPAANPAYPLRNRI